MDSEESKYNIKKGKKYISPNTCIGRGWQLPLQLLPGLATGWTAGVVALGGRAPPANGNSTGSLAPAEILWNSLFSAWVHAKVIVQTEIIMQGVTMFSVSEWQDFVYMLCLVPSSPTRLSASGANRRQPDRQLWESNGGWWQCCFQQTASANPILLRPSQ